MIALALALAAPAALVGCDSAEAPEVSIQDLRVGEGEAAQVGDSIYVHYKGWTESGSVFDEGAAGLLLRPMSVIDGWVQGIPGQRVGGLRRLTIPPELGYGARGIRDASGAWVIPPNATLVFDVELRRVVRLK